MGMMRFVGSKRKPADSPSNPAIQITARQLSVQSRNNQQLAVELTQEQTASRSYLNVYMSVEEWH